MAVVVLDIGGSSSRLAVVRPGQQLQSATVKVTDRASLVRAVRDATSPLDGVAISLAAFVDSEHGYVRMSRAAPELVGELEADLTRSLGCPVVVLNDGEAHAYAASAMPDVEHGTLAISLGTSVGFGLTDRHGCPMIPCSGENWDLGEWKLDTRASSPEAWWALGSSGLKELEQTMGSDRGRAHYGYRLGSFIERLSAVFQPRTVVLSGGIARNHWDAFKANLRGELEQLPKHFTRPRVMVSPYPEAALIGAAEAFARRNN
ncbi:MAG: hypothetical protein QOH56_390 [Pseudonocardiales bacterium]|jgi:predicted NBD/HSP70 family sugar kinase|nr:hypothetical protein [Pseudonocardiales bacterium]